MRRIFGWLRDLSGRTLIIGAILVWVIVMLVYLSIPGNPATAGNRLKSTFAWVKTHAGRGGTRPEPASVEGDTQNTTLEDLKTITNAVAPATTPTTLKQTKADLVETNRMLGLAINDRAALEKQGKALKAENDALKRQLARAKAAKPTPTTARVMAHF